MSSHTRAGLFCSVALLFSSACHACGERLHGHVEHVSGTDHYIAYSTAPHPIVVGRHFSMQVAVCPRNRASRVQSLRVNADMPDHKHGMNYLPVVTTRNTGLFQVTGLMFHMPGRWEIKFDVTSSRHTVPQRVTHGVVME